MELHRGSASLMTKHPDVFGKQLIWVRGKGARAVRAAAVRNDDLIRVAQSARQAARQRLPVVDDRHHDAEPEGGHRW